MKILFRYATLLFVSATFLISSCKKKADDVVPVNPQNPGKPSVKVDFLGSDYGKMQNLKVSATVSTQGDSAYIFLSVDGTEETSYIYMQKSENNAEFESWRRVSGPLKGKSLDGSAFGDFTEEASIGTRNYTYEVSTSALKKAFKLTIPIVLRTTTSAKSDVFRLWITSGAGKFNNPAKNLAYGIAEISFNYTNQALITNYSTELGNTANADGSLFSTATGSSYTRKETDDDAAIGKLIDFLYNTTGTGTTLKYIIASARDKDGNVDATATVGFQSTGFANITNITKMAEYTGTTDFDNIVGETDLISAVGNNLTSTSTTTKVEFSSNPAGKVVAFITESGKKGLVKIVSASGDGSTSGSAVLKVKVTK
jgi:hypothetical protein